MGSDWTAKQNMYASILVETVISFFIYLIIKSSTKKLCRLLLCGHGGVVLTYFNISYLIIYDEK